MLRTSAFINLLTPADKAKYVDTAWDILQRTYASIGGYQGAPTPEALIKDSFLWKLSRKNGEVVALAIYRKQFGRKRVASGTNNTSTGKNELFAIYKEDFTRAWTECSGAVEKALLRLGGEHYIIPAEYASKLTGKDCTPSEDGLHYTRLINGKPYEKVIIGTPQGF